MGMKINRPISAEGLSTLNELRRSKPLREIAQIISVSEFTLVRALAGFNLQPNTAFCIETKLREFTAKQIATGSP
jgi:hypothetical protein